LDAKFSLPAAGRIGWQFWPWTRTVAAHYQLIPDSQVCRSLKDAFTISGTGAVPIFLPATLLLEGDPFTPSWEVTSDSIAAYIANQLDAPKVVFATDVDGSYPKPQQNPNAKLTQHSFGAGTAKIWATHQRRHVSAPVTFRATR
jgi:hypothetical protein